MTRSELAHCTKILGCLGTELEYYMAYKNVEIIGFKILRVSKLNNSFEILEKEFNNVTELISILIEDNLVKWMPEIGDKYWCLDSDGSVKHSYFETESFFDVHLKDLKNSNMFETEKEAQKYHLKAVLIDGL